MNPVVIATGELDQADALSAAVRGRLLLRRYDRWVYQNDDVGFYTDSGAGLVGAHNGALALGDYDNDGDLDIAIAGQTAEAEPGMATSIYRNDGGGTYEDIDGGLTGVAKCSLAWGDYDSDGDLDLAVAGAYIYSTMAHFTRLYRNDGGVFVELDEGLLDLNDCALAWGDYDGDGDLDLAAAGRASGSELVALIYRNDGGASNTPPTAPVDLSAEVTGTAAPYDVRFTWSAASDNETPSLGLSYNLRVGTTAGGDEVFSSLADVATGWRRIPARGIVQPGDSLNEWTLHLPAGTYHWSVQAIDTAFAGGAWAGEQTVTVP